MFRQFSHESMNEAITNVSISIKEKSNLVDFWMNLTVCPIIVSLPETKYYVAYLLTHHPNFTIQQNNHFIYVKTMGSKDW